MKFQTIISLITVAAAASALVTTKASKPRARKRAKVDSSRINVTLGASCCCCSHCYNICDCHSCSYKCSDVSVPHVIVALWPTDSPLYPSAHSHHLISLARHSAGENAESECPARRRRSVANRLTTVSLRTLTLPHRSRTPLCRRERRA